MNEAEIVRRIVKKLNSLEGVFCLRTHGGSFQTKGTPDILGCAKGRFFAIEAKQSPKHKPTEAQKYILSKFNEAGGMTFVSHDPDAKEIIKWIGSLR